MSLPDIPIPEDFYDGEARKDQVIALGAKARAPAIAEVDQTVTLRGDAAITVTDGNGAAIAEAALVRVWFATTANGAPSATNNTVAVTTGTIIQAVTANAHLLVATDANGAIALNVTINTAGTRYLMAEIGGKVVSQLLTIEVIE